MTRHPVPAAIAVVVRKDQVLLVRRRNEPDAGRWGYPGGKIEFGETVEDAVLRELREETGIEASAGNVLTTLDIIDASVPHQNRHFSLIAVECRWKSGEPIPGDDALEARWVPVEDVLGKILDQSESVDLVLAIAQGRSVLI